MECARAPILLLPPDMAMEGAWSPGSNMKQSPQRFPSLAELEAEVLEEGRGGTDDALRAGPARSALGLSAAGTLGPATEPNPLASAGRASLFDGHRHRFV